MAQTNDTYDPLFDYYGRLYNVDPRLGKTVFHIESDGNPQTKDSSAGAEGGMQIMPDTAIGLGIADPKDMNQAIPAAMKNLADGLKQTGTAQGALAYYHGGPDTSKWGPKTQYYVAKGQAMYPQMQITSAANDTAAPTPDTDFNKRWGLTAPTATSAPSNIPTTVIRPSQAPVDQNDFNKRWGLESSPPAVAPPSPEVAAVPITPSAAPAVMGDPRVALNSAGGDQWAPSPAANPLSAGYQAASAALAPAPNTTYGTVIPFARDDATGTIRPAIPSAMRGLAQGATDLAFGPSLGTVTPAATATLTNLVPAMMGGASAMSGGLSLLSRRASGTPPPSVPPSVAPNPLMSAPSSIPAPQFIPPGTTSPTLLRIRQLIDADNAQAASRPTEIPPSAPQPPNPLNAAPGAPPPGTPVVKTAPTAAVASLPAQEAAEMAAIPEKLPPAPLVPPVTQGAADARADQLLRHFSAGKPVTENPDIVPGYVPKLSGLTNDPGIATLERGVQAVSPGPLGVRDQTNKLAINSFVDNLKGLPEDVEAAQAQRDASTDALRDAALINSTPVDPSRLISKIDGILASPEGKRAAVQRALSNVRDSLFNADGEMETEPAMLYGVRKNLNDLLDPVAQKDNPQLQQAARQLIDVKNSLDDTIESGAPGFKDYVAKYAELSKPIDAQRYIQSLNLTDAQGNVRLANVDSALKGIEKQQNMPGVQRASAVSPEQLSALQTLRNTLRMDQFSGSAGKTLGSNTFQNLATNSRVGQMTGNPFVSLGLGALGDLASGGITGGALAAGASMAAHRVLGNSETMVRDALIRRLLNHQGAGAAALNATP